MPITVGQAAPDFTLHETPQQQRSLSDYRGKNVCARFLPRGVHRRLHHRDVRFAGPDRPVQFDERRGDWDHR